MAKDRFREVALDFPFEVDGYEISEVVVHRMTAGEVRDYIAAKGAPEAFTMIRTKTGRVLAPSEIDLMDDDDALRVEGAVQDFLPLRLMGVMGGVDEQTPDIGDPIAPSLQPNSPDSDDPST